LSELSKIQHTKKRHTKSKGNGQGLPPINRIQGGKHMSTTQPIRDKKQLRDFKGFYASKSPDNPNALRNQTLMVLGLNTALRISDILRLTWDDVFDGDKIKKHIVIREQKTGKENRILINGEARKILREYHSHQFRKNPKSPKNRDGQEKLGNQENQEGQGQTANGSPYLFPSPKKKGAHLSRFQAHRIIRQAAKALKLEHVSCHSLRKTFGYHTWKQGVQPALLMSIFNHSSWHITMRYLGITQDEKDKVFARVAL